MEKIVNYELNLNVEILQIELYTEEPISEEVLNKLRNIPNIRHISVNPTFDSITIFFKFIHRYYVMGEIRNILNQYEYNEIVEHENKLISTSKYNAIQRWNELKYSILFIILLGGIVPKFLQHIYNWTDQFSQILTTISLFGGIGLYIILYLQYFFKK